MKRLTFTAAALAALLCTSTATATAATGNDGIAPGEHAFVDVTAATLWVEPDTARDLDEPSLANPVDLDQWNDNMADTETRRWLTGKLETQAVLGSEVEVTEISGDWAHVLVLDQPTPRNDDGYPGWMPVRQLTQSTQFGWEQQHLRWAQVTDNKARLTRSGAGHGQQQQVSFNTRLPVLADTPHALLLALPDGSRGWLDSSSADVYAPGEKPATPSKQELVDTGKQFLGLRYLWAGVSAYGFDCSGFTSSIYRAHGITIPRDADAQAETGKDVDTDDLQQGDLLFFAQPGGSGFVHHVGMYIGDGKMIHAPNASTTVSIVDWQDWDSDDEFAGAKRIL